MSLLLVGLAAGLLALVLRRGVRRRAPAGLVALAYAVPALFLAFVLWTSRDEATRLRFALLGLGFRGEPDVPLAVAVGGDRDAHDVWISALAEERQDAAGTATSTLLGRLIFEPGEPERLTWEPGEGPGMLGVRAPAGDLRPLRALELMDGDRLRFDGRSFEVRLAAGRWDRLFGPPAVLRDEEGREVALPRRRGTLPLTRVEIPIWGVLPATAETYPLAFLGRESEGAPDGGRTEPGGFIFRRPEGLLGGRLWLAPGAETALERSGEAVAIPAAVEIPAGAALHVLSPPRWNGEGFRAGGVRDRRSFRWRSGRRSLALVYDTPEIYVLSRDSLEELAIEPAAGEDAETLRVHLSLGGWQITDRSLHFRHASRKIALEALAILELPRDLVWAAQRAGFRQADIQTATPRGQRRTGFGEPVWLGGEHLAAVQVDLLSPPALLGALALALAALKTVAARSVGLRNLQLLFAAALEALLALRLLAGYRVWVLPPFAEEAYELALIAWSLLPWTFLLAAGRIGERLGRRAVARALPALGGLLFSFAWSAVFAGGFRLQVWALCHLLALVAWLAGASGLLDAAIDRARRVLPGLRRPPAQILWVLAAFVPGLLRVALVFLGWRESVELGGQRLALTLAHVPAAILIEAAYLVWLWRRTAAEGRLRPADLAPALAIVAGTWLLPALVVSDLGLFLLNVPVFLVALASLTLAAARRLAEDGLPPRRWLHWTPAAALGLYLLFAALPLGARALVAALPQAATFELASERNYLRLLAFAYPRELERLARRGSEELMVMSAVMGRYTSGPFAGRGYFRSELSPHLAATALREHAPAVFVAAEWGLAGILGLLALYVVLAGSGLAAAPWRSEEHWLDPEGGPGRFRLAVAALAAVTFSLPSIYMILANYRLTLFTGKNAYLLGLDSTADVLEAFALVLLFALGTAAGDDDRL